MKFNVKKLLIYTLCFVLLFALGVIISDTIIVARAKYMLHIADSLNFEKDIKKAYPEVPIEQDGFKEIEKVAAALDKLPDGLQELDRKLNIYDKSLSEKELQTFWNAPEIITIANSLPSVPYTAAFNLKFYSERGKLTQKLLLIKRLHTFYINYLKFSAAQGSKLQILHIFQKLLTLHRALERQNLAQCEYFRQTLWVSALEAIVHYGPKEKRYEEYYLALQKLIQSLDFEYCPQLTIRYNNLKIALNHPPAGDNLIQKHKNYISSIKELTKELRDSLMQYPLPPDLKRNPPLEKDFFAKEKTITQTQLQILMFLKLYQLKNGFYPEAIEGFPELAMAEELTYKRISPDEFVLKRKNHPNIQ